MSDEQKPDIRGSFDPVLQDVTIEKLLTFLDESGAIPRCWLCGQHTLRPLQAQRPTSDSGDGNMVRVDAPAFTDFEIQKDRDNDYAIIIPAFTMSCSNCGFTFTMSATPLIDWMKKREQ